MPLNGVIVVCCFPSSQARNNCFM